MPFFLLFILFLTPYSLFAQNEDTAYYDDEYYNNEYYDNSTDNSESQNNDEYYYQEYTELQVTNTFYETNQIIASNNIFISNYTHIPVPSISTINPNICLAVLKGDLNDIRAFLSQNPSLLHTPRGDGDSLLHIAATTPNAEIADYLIKRGANVNSTNQIGRTPLHIAAQYNNLPVTKILIQNNASVRAKDNLGQTPMWIANVKGYPTLLTLLAIAQTNQPSSMITVQKTKKPKKALGISPPSLFDLYDNFVYKVSRSGPITNTPWHKALFTLGFEEAKTLVELGMNPYYPNEKGQTALHIATIYDNTSALEYFFSLPSVKLNLIDNFGNTPLHQAAEKSSSNTIKFLMNNGCNIYQTNSNSWTPFFNAVLYKNNDAVRYFLQQGISPNTKTDKARTPLHESARLGFQFIVRDLLAAGAEFQAADYQGNTPLFLAVENGHIDIVSQLHQKGDIGTNLNYKNETPLHAAIKNNHLNIVYYLVNNMNIDIGIIDDLGRTALDIAYAKGNNDIIAYLTEKYMEQQTKLSSTLIEEEISNTITINTESPEENTDISDDNSENTESPEENTDISDDNSENTESPEENTDISDDNSENTESPEENTDISDDNSENTESLEEEADYYYEDSEETESIYEE